MQPGGIPERREQQQQQLRRCNTSTRTPRRTAEHISAISPSAYHRVNSFPNGSLDAPSLSSFASSYSTASRLGSTQRHGSAARIRDSGGTPQHLRAKSFEQDQQQCQIQELEDASCSTVESLDDFCEDLQSRLQDEQQPREQSTHEDENFTAMAAELQETRMENARLQAHILELERQLQAATMVCASECNDENGRHVHGQEQQRDSVVDSDVPKPEEGNGLSARNMRQLVQGLSYSLTAGIIVAAGVRVGIELFGKYLRRA
jgi:hypothetical protein